MAEEFVSHLRWLLIGSFIPFSTSFVVCDIVDDGNLLQGCVTLANNYLKWREHTESCCSTRSPSCLNQSTLPIALTLTKPFSVLSVLLCYSINSASADVHPAHILDEHIHTLQSLSPASGKTSQSAQRQLTVSTILPLKLGICTANLALYHSSQASTIFLLTNHTLKTAEILNALRKGHDIQKWHSLWGNGLDVWPINKVSSIRSISELFGGLFLILKAFHPTLSCVTAPPEAKPR